MVGRIYGGRHKSFEEAESLEIFDDLKQLPTTSYDLRIAYRRLVSSLYFLNFLQSYC